MKKKMLALGASALVGGSAFAATVYVSSDITSDTVWTSGNTYILDDVIYVKGATLDIEAGTVVRGQPGTSSLVAGSLVVRPDAKIQIRGTSLNPVIFTTAAVDVNGNGVADTDAGGVVRWSAGQESFFLDLDPKNAPLPPLNPLGGKNAQLWGGLIIAGDAPTNNGNQVNVVGDSALDDGYGLIEGLTGSDAIYGGVNSEHNGGSIKYVSIRHGGIGLAPDKEINALTLYSVGSKTTIENVDIYCTSDDGVEIFGGTVNLKNININYADDDGFDVDEGWQGVAQFVFTLQGLGYGDLSLELDGDDTGESQGSTPLYPAPDSRLYNFTSWHANTAKAAVNMKAGFGGAIVNSVFQNISGTTIATGINISGLSGSDTVSARDKFNTGLLQLRNNNVVGFTTSYAALDLSTIDLSATGAVTGTFGGLTPNTIPNVLYPATLNRSNLALYGAAGPITVNHTVANGVDPRPSLTANNLAYGTTQDAAYVPAPAIAVGYKGAFDRTAASLWTSGWTALNKRGILKN